MVVLCVVAHSAAAAHVMRVKKKKKSECVDYESYCFCLAPNGQ